MVPENVAADSARYGNLSPMLAISDPALSDFANAAGYLYIFPRNDEQMNQQRVNFIFISSRGALINDRINPEMLTMFDDHAIPQIMALDFDNDKCHVLALSTEKLGEIVLGVNDEAVGSEELNYRCFLLALAFFDGNVMNSPSGMSNIQDIGDRPVLEILAEILVNKDK